MSFQVLLTPECEALPVGSIIRSAWNLPGQGAYAVRTPDHWLMLDSDRTKGLRDDLGGGWVVEYVPEEKQL